MEKNNEITYYFDNKFRVREFNNKQKWCLQEIIGKLDEIKDVKYFIGYWDDRGDFQIVENEKLLNLENEHNFLNYYWCEYKKDNKNYKITMFYKDFDCGSGNIHVLPGAIQIWRLKQNCDFLENGFCEDELQKAIIKNGKVEYSCKGGKSYTEFGWKPLFEHLQLWDAGVLKNLINMINDLKKDELGEVECDINIKSFYASVMNPPKGTVSSQSRGKYILLQFNKKFLYYKTMYINGYGYFTKYDGKEVSFKYGNNENTKGPNYYDTKKGSWVIQKELYRECPIKPE